MQESQKLRLLIPNAINNFIFELRESCRQIDDHKQHSINAIQCRLRSSICRQLSRSSNMKLFIAFGITFDRRLIKNKI